MPGLTLPFSKAVSTDQDVFAITNQLGVGQSDKDIGALSTIVGRSNIAHGVHGVSGPGGGTPPQDPTNMGIGTGVWGESTNGYGVYGESSGNKALGLLGGKDRVFGQNVGVYGESDTQGVFGHATNDSGTGVFGNSNGGGFGVRGESVDGTAVQGQSFGNGIAVRGMSQNGVAGQFEGRVFIPSGNLDMDYGNVSILTGNITVHNGNLSVPKGNISLDGGNINMTGAASIFLERGDVTLAGADCAEEFDVSGLESIEPGSVLVIGMRGALEQSEKAYDKKVVGIVSGGGEYKPGVVLDKRKTDGLRVTVALLGKVYCKVDAQNSPIEVGDLLTTSSTPGHAMKADQPLLAFGAVIGKALAALKEGKGMIPVLVALQ